MTPADESRWDSRRVAFALLALIVALHLVVSAAFVWRYGDRFSDLTSPDAKRYETMVKQWLTEGVYGYDSTEPNAYVTPGYPAFLAAAYWIGGYADDPGRPYMLIVVLQILCNVGSIVLAYALGSVLIDRRAGLIAAALLALYPPLFYIPLLLLTESLGMTTLLLYVLVQTIALRRSSIRLSLAAGALLAIAVFVRPGVAPLAVAPFVYEFFARGKEERLAVAGLAAIALAGWVLVTAPWIVRNQVVLGTPSVFSSHSGDPMLAGVDPYYYEMGEDFRYHGPTYKRYLAERPAIDKASYARKAIVEMFAQDPLRTSWWFTVGKTVRMYSEPWVTGKTYVKSATLVLHYLIVALGFTGMLLAFVEPRVRALALMIVFGTIALLPFVPEPRFVYGFLPLLAVLAATVLRRAWQACEADGEVVAGAQG